MPEETPAKKRGRPAKVAVAEPAVDAVEAETTPEPRTPREMTLALDVSQPAQAQRAPIIDSQTVVYKSIANQIYLGRFITPTVLGDVTVTLEDGVPQDFAPDVAHALAALSCEHYQINLV